MTCVVETSSYDFINGRLATVDVDLNNGLLEILVEGHGRFVVARNEVSMINANDLPY